MAGIMSNSRISALLSIGALVATVGTGGCSSAGDGTPGAPNPGDTSEALSNGCSTAQCVSDVNTARNATSKYKDVNKAIADGFVQVSPCVTDLNGVTPGSVGNFGTLGVHFLNQARITPFPSVGSPTVLVYIPNDDGGLDLAAAEYVVPIIQNGAVYTDPTAAPTSPQPAPTLFDKKLIGPVAPHFPGGPWHYETHAWIWKDNPNGLTAPSNSAVSCTPE